MKGIIEEMRDVVAEIIGDDAKASDVVYALMKRFGGGGFYLPCDDYEKRNREIKRLRADGIAPKTLSDRYKLSIKTIYRILKSN